MIIIGFWLTRELERTALPKQSPLHDFFVSRGATFATRGEWETPEVFSSWEEEYQAAREAVAVGERSYRGRIRIKGSDRVRFLQNMLSNDVQSLAVGDGQYAAFLSRKGKLISDMFVFQHEDAVLLEMEPSPVARLSETLSRYIVSEDVDLENVSQQEALVAVAGPRSSELLSRLTDDTVPELAPFHFTSARVGDTPIQVSAVRHGPGPGFDVTIPADHATSVLERLMDVGQSMDVRLAGHRAMDTRRIESGMPLFGIDMNESHLLLEADMKDAVSFKKGCYIGQEYVARLAHRGHLNRKLVGLRLDAVTVPDAGDDIIGEGRYAGQVTSATSSPALGHAIALGYVHRDFFEPGASVSIRNESGDLPAEVVERPFIE